MEVFWIIDDSSKQDGMKLESGIVAMEMTCMEIHVKHIELNVILT